MNKHFAQRIVAKPTDLSVVHKLLVEWLLEWRRTSIIIFRNTAEEKKMNCCNSTLIHTGTFNKQKVCNMKECKQTKNNS